MIDMSTTCQFLLVMAGSPKWNIDQPPQHSGTLQAEQFSPLLGLRCSYFHIYFLAWRELVSKGPPKMAGLASMSHAEPHWGAPLQDPTGGWANSLRPGRTRSPSQTRRVASPKMSCSEAVRIRIAMSGTVVCRKLCSAWVLWYCFVLLASANTSNHAGLNFRTPP